MGKGTDGAFKGLMDLELALVQRVNEALKCKTLGTRYDRGSDVDVSNILMLVLRLLCLVLVYILYTVVNCIHAYQHIQQQHLHKLFYIAYQYIANTRFFFESL